MVKYYDDCFDSWSILVIEFIFMLLNIFCGRLLYVVGFLNIFGEILFG